MYREGEEVIKLISTPWSIQDVQIHIYNLINVNNQYILG